MFKSKSQLSKDFYSAVGQEFFKRLSLDHEKTELTYLSEPGYKRRVEKLNQICRQTLEASSPDPLSPPDLLRRLLTSYRPVSYAPDTGEEMVRLVLRTHFHKMRQDLQPISCQDLDTNIAGLIGPPDQEYTTSCAKWIAYHLTHFEDADGQRLDSLSLNIFDSLLVIERTRSNQGNIMVGRVPLPLFQ